MTYKVLCFFGEPNLKVKAQSAVVELRGDGLTFAGELDRVIPYAEISDVRNVMLNGLGTMCRLQLDGESLSMLVPRVNLGGVFVIVNRVATWRLSKEISEHLGPTAR